MEGGVHASLVLVCMQSGGGRQAADSTHELLCPVCAHASLAVAKQPAQAASHSPALLRACRHLGDRAEGGGLRPARAEGGQVHDKGPQGSAVHPGGAARGQLRGEGADGQGAGIGAARCAPTVGVAGAKEACHTRARGAAGCRDGVGRADRADGAAGCTYDPAEGAVRARHAERSKRAL